MATASAPQEYLGCRNCRNLWRGFPCRTVLGRFQQSSHHISGPSRYSLRHNAPCAHEDYRASKSGRFSSPCESVARYSAELPDSVETALGRVRVRVEPRLAFHDDEGRLSCVLPDCGVTEYYDVSLRAYKLPLVQGDPPCVTHWLRRGVYGVAVLGGALDLGTVQMTNGDCDGDNEITILDFGLLVAAFGSMPGDSNWDTRADVDGDGEVTLGDFAILTRNFGAAGDDNWWEGDPCVF
jgi:hypothetical protein